MSRFEVHFYIIENQLKHYRYLKENLKEHECFLKL